MYLEDARVRHGRKKFRCSGVIILRRNNESFRADFVYIAFPVVVGAGDFDHSAGGSGPVARYGRSPE
jgi:hypothetical protein